MFIVYEYLSMYRSIYPQSLIARLYSLTLNVRGGREILAFFAFVYVTAHDLFDLPLNLVGR